MKRAMMSLAAAGILGVVSTVGGIRPVHAMTLYTCTKTVNGHLVTQYAGSLSGAALLERMGFSCTQKS